MTSEHTPEVWHVVRYGDGDSLVICEDEVGEKRIAFMAVPGSRFQDERKKTWKRIKANARLIAAAPDLLEALKGWDKLHADMIGAGGALEALPDGMIERFAKVQLELMVLTRAALAKAEGRS